MDTNDQAERQENIEELNRQVVINTKPQKPKKIKFAIYLNEKAEYAFTELYIQRLRKNRKIDRSTIVCEALQASYENNGGTIDLDEERVIQYKIEKKSSSTIYLTEEAEYALTELYIHGLRKNRKIDRSMIACEALQALYEQECCLDKSMLEPVDDPK